VKSTIVIYGVEVELRHRKSAASVRRVYATDSVVIDERSSADISVRFTVASVHAAPSNWLVEPQALNGRLLVARGLFEDIINGKIMVLNPTYENMIVKSGQFAGNAQPLYLFREGCGPVCASLPHNDVSAALVSDNGTRSVAHTAAADDVVIQPLKHDEQHIVRTVM
jgi:hypothetical protein